MKLQYLGFVPALALIFWTWVVLITVLVEKTFHRWTVENPMISFITVWVTVFTALLLIVEGLRWALS